MKPRNLLHHLLFAAATLLGLGSAAATDYTSYTNNSNLTLASGDTLTVSSGNVDISYGGSGTGLERTLDASLAAAVTFNIGSLRIGTRSDPTNTSTSDRLGTLNLGADNTITASTIVSIGGGGHIISGIITTAANSTTVINTPVMDIGTAMRTSTPAPNITIGSGSTFTLQGINGGRTALVVGEERQASSSINWGSSGTMSLSGGRSILKLSSLVVGRSLFAASETGAASGTLTMSGNAANQLDISGTGSVVQVGASSGNQTTGTITIGNFGSNSTITSTDNSTAILIGNRTTSSGDSVSGTLNLNGGTVTITTTGAAIAGGSNAGTRALNLNGGVTLKAGASSSDWIRNLTTAVINSGGAVIDTNSFDLGVSKAFSGAGGLTKAGDGTLTLSGVNTYTGNTTVAAGTLVLADDAGLTFDVTDTASNKITGAGAATLEGDFTINTTAVTVETGSWVLVDTATKSFTSTFSVAGGWTESGGVWTFEAGEDTWRFSEATGTLTLNDDAPPVDDYAAWNAQYADDDLSDPNADNDGDGLSNFEEYAFGLDPTSGASTNPIADISELQSDGIFTYTRRANSGLTYSIWTSTDLSQWNGPAGVNIEEFGPIIDGARTVTVELSDAPPAGKFFLRVKAD